MDLIFKENYLLPSFARVRAINILRKYLSKNNIIFNNVLGEKIYNPIKINLFCEV